MTVTAENMTLPDLYKKLESLALSPVAETQAKTLLDFAYEIGRQEVRSQFMEVLKKYE